MQSDAFDFIALAIGVVATLRPSAALLFPQRRLPRLCHVYAYFAVLLAAAFWSAMYSGVLELLEHQSWFSKGNGSEEQVSKHAAVLRCAVLCCAVLCCAVLRCAVQRHGA